jgi:hypothetical protein
MQTGTLSFGEKPYHLVYWDRPTDEDDEEEYSKNNGMMSRFFDQLAFDSIYYYLGVGGQPVAKAVQPGMVQHSEEKNADDFDVD